MNNIGLICENQGKLKKLNEKLQGDSLAKGLLSKRLSLYNAESFFSMPLNLFHLTLLPQLAPAETVAILFRTFSLLCHLEKEVEEYTQDAGSIKKQHFRGQ